MRTAAVMPVKRYARAKQRLAPTVGDADRPGLAAAMVADVLDALGEVAEIDEVIVVTAEPRVAAAACALNARIVDDPVEAGQSAAAALGIAAAVAAGAERVLCVPGDCPALDPEDLRRLLDPAFAAPGVVVVPDRHGTGTNALLLQPPDAIAPGFGEDSCARHRERAARAGVPVRVEKLPSLALDVDTGDDLEALESALSARAGAAPRTRAALALVA